MQKLKKIFTNKILLYVSSRYLVYGLQFVSLIILAAKLGPYNYGIWGFILMLISYLNILNLGIPNSINILVVQHKESIEDIRNYIASAFVVIGTLIAILAIIGGAYYISPQQIFKKFSIGPLFYLILIIGALQYLNVLMVNIFRASNKLFEVAVYQSSVPLGIFIIAVTFNGSEIIPVLVWTYMIMHTVSLIFFLIRGKDYWGGRPSYGDIKSVTYKGFFLFIYNACFYLILTTTSTLVSKYYSVSEYGSYSFSYTLGHSILLLMEAFMYVMFPKAIDKFYSGNNEVVEQTLRSLRINYISLAHGLIYLAISLSPILIQIFPQFRGSLLTLDLMMLAIVLSTNSFGYNTFLIARNNEKVCSLISIITLLLNITVGFTLIKICTVPYYLVVFSIMTSYIFFALLCSYFANRILESNINLFKVCASVMPIRLLIPYIVAICITLLNIPVLTSIPMIVFILFNLSTIKEMSSTISTIINRPQIIDIQK